MREDLQTEVVPEKTQHDLFFSVAPHATWAHCEGNVEQCDWRTSQGRGTKNSRLRDVNIALSST